MARPAHDDDANLQDVHPDGVTLSSGVVKNNGGSCLIGNQWSGKGRSS